MRIDGVYHKELINFTDIYNKKKYMENVNQYKKRFMTLLESTLGNVKPLINEYDLPTAEVVASNRYKDFYLNSVGKFILKANVKPNKCLIPAEKVYYQSANDDITKEEIKRNEEYLKYHLQRPTQTSDVNVTELVRFLTGAGCSVGKVRNVPKTEDDLIKPGYSLRYGDRGPLVKKLQQLLANKAEGYAEQFKQSVSNKPNSTPMDGIFGPTTLAVVKEFQKDYGLTVGGKPDGKVGKNTWLKLKDTPIKYDWNMTTRSFESISDTKKNAETPTGVTQNLKNTSNPNINPDSQNIS